MAYCPVCNAELSDETSTCWRCGHDIDGEDECQWVTLGIIEDKFSADFARETLTGRQIPTVIFSRSGFFGNIGLPLNPFYRPGHAAFEVSVPAEFAQEAQQLLDMTLGDKWQKKE